MGVTEGMKERRAKLIERYAELSNEGLTRLAIVEKLRAEGFRTAYGKEITKHNLAVTYRRSKARVTGYPSIAQPAPPMKYEPGFAKFILYSSELDDAKKVSILKLFWGSP